MMTPTMGRTMCFLTALVVSTVLAGCPTGEKKPGTEEMRKATAAVKQTAEPTKERSAQHPPAVEKGTAMKTANMPATQPKAAAKSETPEKEMSEAFEREEEKPARSWPAVGGRC